MRPALHDSTDYECPFFKVVEKLVQEAGTARCLNPNHGAVFKNSPARARLPKWMKSWHEVSALVVLTGTIPPEQSVHGSSARSPVREPLDSDMGMFAGRSWGAAAPSRGSRNRTYGAGLCSSFGLGSAKGNQSRKSVPWPRLLSSSTLPPCSRRMRCTIIRPSPEPFCLVV